jgi:hypothetical protein
MSSKQPILAAIVLFCATAAQAQTMTADQAREFVSGGLFSYRCFDGTTGAGRIFTDGSAAGSIRVMGRGNARYLHLPQNTLYIAGSQVCARLKGIPFEPCFNLTKTGPDSFRGSVSHMNFMYCDFSRGSVLQLARRRGTGATEKAEKNEKAIEKTDKNEKTEKAEKAEHKPAEANSVNDMQLRR